jgi:hypothetical protein
MDPDANLKEQLELARLINARRETGHEVDGDAVELADLVEALHGWITRGGFLPKLWRREV